MKPLIAIAALTLAACATPRERIRTVEIRTPVPVACIDPADLKPMPPKPVETLPNDPVAALATAVSWLADLVPWAFEADGRLRACAAVREAASSGLESPVLCSKRTKPSVPFSSDGG